MKQWWDDRQPRERTLILCLGAVLAVFALYQFGLKPLLSYRTAAIATYEDAAALLSEVEAASREIQALRSTSVLKSDAIPRTVIGATASELGLPITRLQPHENGGLDVWLDDVPSTALFKWVAVLYERHGIAVVRASIQKNDDGATVRAQITFTEGNES